MKNALTALGAPELPARHFYRLTSDFIGTVLQVRRKRRIGSALVAECYIFPDQSPTPEWAIRNAGRKLDRAMAEKARERYGHKALAAYMGDHK
ncbi:hypothetical protein ACFUT3_30440 [Streptomyces cinereoruber]|uniref:hypothetical protein n=1 Tax=Streptomyces cinereoruber TaxID=67260 RepID=UPI003625E705